MRHLTAALLLGVAATATAQNVLVYDTLSSGELSWYSGGDFQIRQVAATSDAGRTITIGFSDGLAADSSAPGATGLDWDAFPVGQPTPLGMVDIGSSEPGGMATGVVLYFQFDPVAGYLVTRLQ